MSTTMTPFGAVPSARQLAWHALEFYGFLHFTTNKFTDKEWGYGDESPQIFSPSDFDPDSIARIAQEIGMRGLILTAKHHDGFCLWPTKTTDHHIGNSPHKNDVVKAFERDCRRQKLNFGVYLSPWDRNHPEYDRPGYVDVYRT
jgi:alpha-L-fucosidase